MGTFLCDNEILCTYFRIFCVSYGKYATQVPDGVAYGIYEWFNSLKKHSSLYHKIRYGTADIYKENN